MRGTRWLLLLAILALLAAVGVTYRNQSRVLRKEALIRPPSIPPELSGTAEEWQWQQHSQNRPVVEVRAKNLKQEKDSDHVQLDHVELHIFSKTGNTYDRVRSARAEFDQKEGVMYSEGEVDITLEVPVTGLPSHRLVSIQSSGVRFESKTGKAATDRPVSFTFEHGGGKSMGAAYDPTTRELHLKAQVDINWQESGPRSKPMRIEAGELTYREADSKIVLGPWSRLTRENTVLNAAGAIVTLKERAISAVDTQNAQGIDEYPKRKLEYAAGELHAEYADNGLLRKIEGRTNAKLVSTSEGSQTTMTSDLVSMEFEERNNESDLKKVTGFGHAAVESRPLAAPGEKIAETRVLRSDTIEMNMRPGGREIDTVKTHAPGRLEFLPNQPDQRRRSLDAERMIITYGAQNRIQIFQANKVRTETESAADEKKNHRVSRTSSRNLMAEFDPGSTRMKRMEQWDDFSYEEGGRRARAGRAVLEEDRNLITLLAQSGTAARMWDPAGSTSADTIRLQQATGDFIAEGHVNSSRLPDRKKKSSEMLSGDDPLQAVAQRMTAANHNRLLHYEGNAMLWQGSNRIQAERIDVDREKRSLTADGGVTSQFLDTDRKKAARVFTVVNAPRLVYAEENRLATYTGGVLLTRAGLRVKSDELRAFLTPANNDGREDDNSRLDKAFAEGHVEIVQTAPDRTRTGAGDHAEYHTDNERIILKGTQAQLIDTVRGNTRGTQLTWFVNDDRLLVSGASDSRAMSRLRRK